MPSTRFLIALINDAAAYNYIATKVCTEILKLPQYKPWFSVASISSCIIVKFGTLLMPAFKAYLEPFEIGENQYDLELFNQERFQAFGQQLSLKEKFNIVLPCLPLSLIRGFGLGFLFYRLINGFVSDHTTLEGNLVPVISITSSALAGLGFFSHTLYCDVNNALNFKKKAMLSQSQLEEPHQESCEKGPSFLSFIINLGCQITNGFLTIASIMTLFGSPILEEDTAATLGIFIALEKGWINFCYFQPKIKNQLSELWNQRPSFCFFKSRPPSQNEEIIELNDAEYSSSENFSKNTSQN